MKAKLQLFLAVLCACLALVVAIVCGDWYVVSALAAIAINMGIFIADNWRGK